MKIRFFLDPETSQPHILRHGVTEQEAVEALINAYEDRHEREGVRSIIGQTDGGRFLRLLVKRDTSVTVIITGYDLPPKQLKAFRRRSR